MAAVAPGEREGANDPPQGVLAAKANSACSVLGGAVDDALDRMDDGIGVLEKKAPKDSCCQRCLKALKDLKDPVQLGRCSPGRLGFFAVAIASTVIMIIEINDEDWEEMCSATFVLALGLFTTIFLGGDIFMFDAFRKILNSIKEQINKFRNSNAEYERQLGELGHVSDGLTEVQKQLGGDIKATTVLLKDMERFAALQTVASVMNQFFAADWDGKGGISGDEAAILVPQLSLLWQMVPDYDPERLSGSVREKGGIALSEMCALVDALVSEDENRCREELDTLCGGGAGGKVFAEEAHHASQPPLELLLQHPACDSGCADDCGNADACDEGDAYDVELALPGMVVTLTPAPMHSMAPVVDDPGAAGPPMSGKAWSKKDGKDGKDADDEEALQPLCTFPLPTCKLGPCSFGPVHVWGFWHLAFLLTVPVSLGLLIAVITTGEILNIVWACLGTLFAIALAGAGRLLEVLRVLRKQVKQLRAENAHYQELNEDLAVKVNDLAELQVGFEKFQALCGCNVGKARALIAKSNTKIKMQGTAVVTQLFKAADKNKNMKIEPDEVDGFVRSIELVFRSLPNFDSTPIRQKLEEEPFEAKNMKVIVDMIVAFGSDLGEAPPKGGGDAARADPGAA
eukprot:CAMPEP_0117475706 /NCGR_PEP_ID=MMETSP0784-20121206/9933_1 /TAXON_ID=39447 /ORGANISM="" /LENGTH=627 /DNA_ID=CAMNT_0005269961 /DNA_START=28 /DNA_END=1911 /DNA_ORIENTATION=+